MSEHYILTFSTEGGRSKQVRVPEPDRDIPPSVIQGAAIRMVNSNVFATASGPLVALRKAEIQTVTRTKVLYE
jgi:hypothetical protein